MILLAILQVLLGALAAVFSYTFQGLNSVIFSHSASTSGNITLDSTPPPAVTSQFILLAFSLAVLVCGLLQLKFHVKGAKLTAIAGAIMSAIYMILSLYAGLANDSSRIYLISFIPLILGIVVSVSGIYCLVNCFSSRAITRRS